MKVLRVFAPLLAVLAISKSWAADSRTIAISSSSIESASVELHTVADPQFGAITIRATASADRHVKSLLLTYQSRTADVPADGLRDLRDADIASLRVIAVFSPPAKPWLLLNMDSHDRRYMKIPGQPATISFVIDNGEVVRRAIMWQTKSGQPYSDDKRLKRSSTQ